MKPHCQTSGNPRVVTLPTQPKSIEIPQAVSVPFMALGEFAQKVGVPVSEVHAWIEAGHLQTVVFGRHRLVNVGKLWKKALGPI